MITREDIQSWLDRLDGGIVASREVEPNLWIAHTPDGAEVPLIYKATIDPAEASTVRLHIQGKLPPGAALYYGFGKDPFCNLTDELDMAVPMFGPMPIRSAN